MKLGKSGNNKINDRANIKRECLLCDTNFTANCDPVSFDPGQVAWEASTLPLSYTRRKPHLF